MKTKFLTLFSAFAFIVTPSLATAQETTMKDHTASYIEMQAANGQAKAFADFLAGAAPVVKETEWTMVRSPSSGSLSGTVSMSRT